MIDIKTRLDSDIMKQLTIKKKQQKDLNNLLKEANKRISSLQFQIKKKIQYQSDIELYKSRFDSAIRENADIEELISLQDEEIKKLTLENAKLTNEIQMKDSKSKQTENDITSISTVITESEQTMKKLLERIDKKEKENQKRRDLINEKNNEISLLNKFIESLKTQNALNLQNEQSLKMQIKKAKEDSKHLNTRLNSTMNQRKIEEESNIMNSNDNSQNKNNSIDYAEKNIKLLAEDGRMVIIGFLKGPRVFPVFPHILIRLIFH